MKIDSKNNTIKTISKKTFDKLTKVEKRITVINDVLSRIRIGQVLPIKGNFCKIYTDFAVDFQLSNKLQDSSTKCEACAKGSLFLGYIGIINDYKAQSRSINGEAIDSPEMVILSEIFTKKQLSLIETAFEGRYYPWNERLTNKEIDKCIDFFHKHKSNNFISDNTSVLKAICNNIKKNGGTFKP